jgi:hypothetical protein
MKSINTILITLAVASPATCIQNRPLFSTGSIASIASIPSKQSQHLLLHVRGGDQQEDITSMVVDEAMMTGSAEVDADAGEGVEMEKGEMNMAMEVDTDASTTDIVTETTDTTATTTSTTGTALLLPIKSAMDKFFTFYMNNLNSHPVQTILLTASIAFIVIWSIMNNGTTQEEEPSKKISTSVPKSSSSLTTTKDEASSTKSAVAAAAASAAASAASQAASQAAATVTAFIVEKKNAIASSQTLAANRGLLTGLSTAAATSLAIYQAVARPSDSNNGSITTSTRSNNGPDVSSYANDVDSDVYEHRDTVFKGV